MKKVFTAEECQVIVKALDGVSRSIEIISNHIYKDFEGDTFAFYAQPFKDSISFAKSTIFQLDKIQKRLQG